jgi:hypothetical protein
MAQLFSGVAFLEKLDTILRQKTSPFKAKNVQFNRIACAIFHFKMSAEIIPLPHQAFALQFICNYD